MNKLKQARIKAGKTQLDISKEIGITPSSYNMYENGERKIPSYIAEKIALLLDLDMEEIFLPATFTIRKTSTKNNIKQDDEEKQ